MRRYADSVTRLHVSAKTPAEVRQQVLPLLAVDAAGTQHNDQDPCSVAERADQCVLIRGQAMT